MGKRQRRGSGRALGFGNCRLLVAIPKDEEYTGISYFQGKKSQRVIRNIVQLFRRKGIDVKIEEIEEASNCNRHWPCRWNFRYCQHWQYPYYERIERGRCHCKKAKRY